MTRISHEIAEIKKFNKYGLLQITSHLEKRIMERGINLDDILDLINQKQTTIIQVHPKGTYNNNNDDVFVLYGKLRRKRKKTVPLHIVIAKSVEEARTYKIVTMYIPDKEFFYAHGRKYRFH